MTTTELRTPPVQARANATIDKIVAAAREEIRLVGRDRYSTGDVAKRAGVSVGVIYRYFPDKFALFEHIYPSTITTVEQLEQLPAGSVVRCSSDEVFWQWTTGMWIVASYDDTTQWAVDELIIDRAPLTVLDRGGLEHKPWLWPAPDGAA